MEGAGAGACLGEVNEGGGGNQQHQQHHLDDGEGRALQDGQLIGALEGVAPVEEDHAHQNAADKAQQAEEGIEVAAGQAEDHAEGAAQEHQAADHHKEAQHKPGQGRAAAPGRKFLAQQRHEEAAQHQPEDFRPDILHGAGRVQPQGAGDVPQEAGDAKAHVHGVSKQHQQRGNDPDGDAGQHNAGLFAVFHHKIPLFLAME